MQGLPWPVQSPTTRSAVKVSSVLGICTRTRTRMDSVTRGFHEDHTCVGPVLGICAGSCPRTRRTHTWMDSVTDLIWLTVSRRQLPAQSLGCLGLVTVSSSPTTCTSTCARNYFQPSPPSWSEGPEFTTVEKQPPVCTGLHQYWPHPSPGGWERDSDHPAALARPCMSHQSAQLPSLCLPGTLSLVQLIPRPSSAPSPSQCHFPASQCPPSASQFHQSPSQFHQSPAQFHPSAHWGSP